MSDTSGAAPPTANAKAQSTVARESRLTLRKNNEEVLRKALQNEARKQCLPHVQAFGECAKQHGLSVVISCRAQNNALTDCMARHYNEEIFAQFLKDGGHPPPQPPRETLVGQVLNFVTGQGKG